MTVYNKRREAREVTIRLARPEDAPDIITLIIKQHGNYYPYADLYSMDFIRRAIEKGDMCIIVAELADGMLAGMTGANRKPQFAGTVEWIMLTIRPSCRGFGMGKALLYFLHQTLAEEPCASTYGHCMSLDTASQEIVAGLGHHITGAFLNCYQVDPHAENFSGMDLPFKHNLIITCLPGNKKDTGPIYVPPAQAGYIQGVYRTLGTTCTFREGGGKPSKATSDSTFTQMEEHRYGEFLGKDLGLDFEKTLDDALERCGALEGQSFNALINLGDPAAPWAYGLLKDRGFFFAGIHALAGPREYMILHYSPALAVPFDRIAVLPGFAGEFAYIREQYEGKKD